MFTCASLIYSPSSLAAAGDAPRTLTHEHEHRPHLREQIDPDSIQKRKIVTEQRTDRAISGSGGSLLAALAPLKFALLDQKTANEVHIIAGASQEKGYVWASASASRDSGFAYISKWTYHDIQAGVHAEGMGKELGAQPPKATDPCQDRKSVV